MRRATRLSILNLIFGVILGVFVGLLAISIAECKTVERAPDMSVNLLRSEEPPRSIIFLRLSHGHC